MKVRELIEMLKDYEDFDIRFRIRDWSDIMPQYRTFDQIDFYYVDTDEKIVFINGED